MHKFSGSGVETAWIRHYSPGTTSGDEFAKAIKVDTNGNVYCTGSSSNGLNGDDFYTVKYDLSGDIVWERFFNGGDFRNDYAECLAIDVNGNVFVSGSSWSGNSPNYTTIKYNSNGDIMWTAKYIKPGNSDGIPTAMTVDKNGNVFVTGWVNGPDSTHNYLTIQYDSDGNEVWAKHYTYPETGDDIPTALVVDSFGNLYVTGSSNGDYATIKYAANGDSLWVKRYNGSMNDLDRATAAAIDDSNYLYVTGEELVFRGRYGDTWIQTTIKYDSSGNSLWIQHSPGRGQSLAVDADGSIYTAGFENVYMVGGFYYITKFTPSGDTVWQQKRLTFYYVNYLNSLLDNFGNLSVVISSGMDGTKIEKYKSNGTFLWTKLHWGINCNSAVGDNNGNVYTASSEVIGSTAEHEYRDAYALDSYKSFHYEPGTNFIASKFMTNGDTAWIRYHNGIKPQSSRPYAFEVDNNGNVVVVGGTNELSNWTHTASVTVKYNSTGGLLWDKLHKGSYEYNRATDITVDPAGNIYVSIISSTSGWWGNPSCEYITVKYTSDGDTLWARTITPQGSTYSGQTSLVLDESGNVYTVVIDNDSLAVVKYDLSGSVIWIRKSQQTYWPIVNYSAGHIYVSWPGGLIKYNTDGIVIWNKNNIIPSLTSQIIDDVENVYIAGPSGDGYKTMKLNPLGDTLWLRQYRGPRGGYGYPSSLAVDHDGNVFVTGSSPGLDSVYETTTIKYSANGDAAWVKRYNVSPPSYGNEIALDNNGNVYVFGSSENTLITMRYSNNGEEEWAARYNLGGGGSSALSGQPVGIRLDANDGIFAVGYGRDVFTTIKYTQTVSAISENQIKIPYHFKLSQNFPNPFNPSTTIRYALPSSAHVKLSIHDILGREIATLVNEEQTAGWREAQWNASNFASGMYFYLLTAGSFSDVKKMLIIK